MVFRPKINDFGRAHPKLRHFENDPRNRSQEYGQLEPRCSIPMDPPVQNGSGIAQMKGNDVYNVNLSLPTHSERIRDVGKFENSFSGRSLPYGRIEPKYSRVFDPLVRFGSGIAQTIGNNTYNVNLTIPPHSEQVPDVGVSRTRFPAEEFQIYPVDVTRDLNMMHTCAPTFGARRIQVRI